MVREAEEGRARADGSQWVGGETGENNAKMLNVLQSIC